MKNFTRKIHYTKYIILLLWIFAVGFLFTISAKAAEPSYHMVAGYSANIDTSIIDSVQIENSSDGVQGHYTVYVYISSEYEASMSGGSVYNYYSLSEFLPAYDASSGQYGSFYARLDNDHTRVDSNGKKTLCYTFEGLNYTGSNGVFSFRVIDGLKRSYGPFTYKVDPSFLNQGTTSVPFTTGDNQVPVTPQKETSSIPEISALKPHLLVDSYSFGSEQVTAGQEFDLSFTLKNFSKNKDARNIIVKVTPGDGVSLKNDTNLFYYDTIGAGKTLTQTVRCKLSLESTTEIQSVTIETSFQYYDKKNQDPVDGGDSIILSVPTGKINRAKITAITIPKDFKQDKEGNVEYGFINNGFAKVYNAEVFVYDEAGTELYWNFIGTVEPGSKATTEKIPLKFTTGGDQNLKLVVQYEDENLTLKSMEKTFVVPVKSTDTSSDTTDMLGGFYGDMGDMDGMDSMGGMDGMNGEPAPSNGLNPIIIVAIVVIVAIILFIIIRKFLKNRKENYDDFYEAFPKEKKESLGAENSVVLLEDSTQKEEGSSQNGDDSK